MYYLSSVICCCKINYGKAEPSETSHILRKEFMYTVYAALEIRLICSTALLPAQLLKFGPFVLFIDALRTHNQSKVSLYFYRKP